jgi:hypothetical protein
VGEITNVKPRPWKLTIPCAIGKMKLEHALCDLGSSVNLMPKSVFDRIGVGEIKPRQITLHLANRTLVSPIGIVEDLLVK